MKATITINQEPYKDKDYVGHEGILGLLETNEFGLFKTKNGELVVIVKSIADSLTMIWSDGDILTSERISESYRFIKKISEVKFK